MRNALINNTYAPQHQKKIHFSINAKLDGCAHIHCINIEYALHRVRKLYNRRNVLNLRSYCTQLMIYALFFSAFGTPSVIAQNLTSPRYIIEDSTVNIDPVIPHDSGQTPRSSLSPADEAEFEKKGHLTRAGYRRENPQSFSFSIKNSRISFGTLSHKKINTASTTLTVELNNIKNYQVEAREYDILRLFNRKDAIPDTICDPNSRCTPNHAALWIKNDVYGLGYNLSGKGTPTDFEDKRYFRPFANEKKKERPIILMQTKNGFEKHQDTKLTLKVVMSSVQVAGTYEHTTTITALPGY